MPSSKNMTWARNHTVFGIVAVVASLVAVALWIWLPRMLTPPPRTANSHGLPAVATLPALMQLETAVAGIRSTSDSATVQAQLHELRTFLQSLPPSTAAIVIRGFLDSTNDAPTHLAFGIGSDGFLAESPSLRVFLLDLLARLDAKVAAAYAKRILETPTAPDEWAVALRNLALGDPGPESSLFLEEKLMEMLRNEEWVNNPSAGFLEAFDVAVHLGGTNLVSPLTALVRSKENPAVAHAAFLALDRMVIQQPAEVLAVMQQQPEMMQGREQTHANYFARADVSDETQRALVEDYLLDPARHEAELTTFAGVFPNANFMISHNLLTQSATPDGAALSRRDRDALGVVETWLRDPRFERLQPQLRQIELRLQTFLRQAEATR